MIPLRSRSDLWTFTPGPYSIGIESNFSRCPKDYSTCGGIRGRTARFARACKMGVEGIVSKRLGSRYRSGRSPDWLKFKNPAAPAMKREAERIGA